MAETVTATVQSLIAQGVKDVKEIQKRLALMGMKASPTLISLLKSGRKSRKVCIPYSKFQESRHLDKFHDVLRELQDWVGDDARFHELLEFYSRLDKATKMLKVAETAA